MLTSLAVGFSIGLPILVVVALLEVAGWRDRVRVAAVARQIALTDAIAEELGALVAPVVRKRLWGPWRIEIAVPWARAAIVGRVVAIAHRVFSRERGRYELVVAPQEEPAPFRGSAGAPRLHARVA